VSVEMSPAAIDARLRRAAQLADLRTEQRLACKIDMSPRTIAARLREVERLRRLCLELAKLRPVAP
jgi:hypothetical protein